MFEQVWKILEILLMVDERSPAARRQRHLVVALFLIGFATHVVWACGWFAPFGLGGFAQSKDLQKISDRLDAAAAATLEVQDRLLKKSIVDTRILQCNAQQKRFFSERLQDQLEEYYRLNKRTYDLPGCEDLK